MSTSHSDLFLTHAVNGYVDAGFWLDIDDTDPNYDPDTGNGPHLQDTDRELADEARAELTAEMADFLTAEVMAVVERHTIPAEQVGHDFYLTRNGHGAGFWDRGYGDDGDKLTDLCKPYGSSTFYVGGDGQVWHQ